MSILECLPTLADRHIGEDVPPAPVHVHQRTWEFERLLDLYRARRPARVLEVGSYEGGTLWHWLQNAPPGARIVSIDDDSMGDGDLREPWQEWVPKDVTLVELRGRSQSPEIAAGARKEGPFDWVFIDADHSYEAVRRDWLTFGAMVTSPALVAFHDILGPTREHPELEVSRLWTEIRNRGYLTRELVADPAAPWGGIGIVYIGGLA